MDEGAAMDLLRSHMSKIQVPHSTTRIFKQECCISFDTPKSERGLFVDLNSFLAFGYDSVAWNYEKTGNAVYLNIKQTVRPESEDRPHKKPTLLAIGIEGGFDVKEPEYEETYSIVILPQFITLPFPDTEIPEKVRLSVDGVLAAVGAERKEQVASWTADKKQVSVYAEGLKQLDNGVRVPPSGWKCARCEKTDNLWLNLSDGSVLCGRRNWDGTGGNNHAIEHYKETSYPLAVKLGTITADLDGADVYSYPEDDAVMDPLLAQHLAHFGIDFSSLKKTELTTAERELDQNVNFDWNRIQEEGKELEPVYGPGYTGLINLGNSCYLASVVQAVFSTRDFKLRYFDNMKLEDAFLSAPADPTSDVNTQLSKLAHGLLSGNYSVPSEKVIKTLMEEKVKPEQKGIPPRMFKALIGNGHPEFSSSRQQDAFEFFQYFLEQVERSHSRDSENDPSRCFKFLVEERIQCSSSGKVKYTKREENVLSLSIPMEAAVNRGEVEAFQKQRIEREQAGEKVSDEVTVRPRVPLTACLQSFSAPEEVEFYSSAINGRTTAIKTTRLATFPQYLVLHMRKFDCSIDAGWVPRKLDVFIDMPETIDISNLRGRGLQPGEELLPETTEAAAETSAVNIDESIVSQLMEMGFPRVRCEKAAVYTSNQGVEAAMNWILSHMDDADVDIPVQFRVGTPNDIILDESAVETLVSFGFPESMARRALKEKAGDVELAAEWIFGQQDNASPMDTINNVECSDSTEQPELPDGSGKYKLLGFISHMGTSTQCGHYVVHLLKEGRWVIYNDCKVALSGDPPKDMGYLYIFERAE